MQFARERLHLLPAAVLLTAAAVGCGGMAGPSGTVKLQGVVLQGSGGAGVAQSTRLGAPAAAAGSITVTVKEAPSITTKVSGNGTFELDNLPTGTFTLTFSANGTVIGEIAITTLAGSNEIKIVVNITDNNVVLVDIKYQNEGENEGNGDNQGGQNKTCMIEGGNVGQHIELEGSVSSGNASAFRMQVNGNRSSGLVDVNASGATFKCNGQKKSTDCKANLAAGDKVHVRGTLTACSTTAASVTATEVMVQK